MSKCAPFPGDEWKHAPQAAALPPTRAEEQTRINRAYALGVIGREEWERGFDELSDVTKWGVEGKIGKSETGGAA